MSAAGVNTGWEVVIGLEIHAQLATKSKIFSGSSTAYGADPNTQANLVDLGYPGVLPVLNKEVVRMATVFGLAIDATVARRSVFARKNYFYPDLPKGYQISQLELPIVEHGELYITDAHGNHYHTWAAQVHGTELDSKLLRLARRADVVRGRLCRSPVPSLLGGGCWLGRQS